MPSIITHNSAISDKEWLRLIIKRQRNIPTLGMECLLSGNNVFPTWEYLLRGLFPLIMTLKSLSGSCSCFHKDRINRAHRALLLSLMVRQFQNETATTCVLGVERETAPHELDDAAAEE